jgi:hypothetical protein
MCLLPLDASRATERNCRQCDNLSCITDINQREESSP